MKGNKGGGRKGYGEEKQIGMLKGMTLGYAIDKMENGTAAEKKEIVMRILPYCFPRENKLSGDARTPLVIKILTSDG